MGQLFPGEGEVESLKRELARLIVEEYIETVKDIRFLKKSEMRVFGKQYSGEDVYIKIRVEYWINTEDTFSKGLFFGYIDIQCRDNITIAERLPIYNSS